MAESQRMTHKNDLHASIAEMLVDRRALHLQFLCYKHAIDPAASSHSFFVPLAQPRRSVTSSLVSKAVKVPNYTSSLARKAISFRGPSCWNKVKENMRLAETFMAFRRLASSNLRIADG